MALKTFKPITPGLRQLVIVDRSRALQGQAGQGADRGQAVVRRPQQSSAASPCGSAAAATSSTLSHRRFQAPQARRRRRRSSGSNTIRTAPPSSRSSRYADGEQAYIIAPQRLAAGDKVIAGEQVDVKPGNAMPLGNMPVGTIVHNVELKIGKGGADRPLGRHLRADRRPRPGLCRSCA